MHESANKRAVIVGLFVLIGLVILISGILMVGNLHETFKKKMTVVAFFEDVNGLQAGNNIWFSGVKVGTIRDIRFRSRSSVEVTLRVDVHTQDYIRKDAKVKISTDGLIGNKIVVIYGGSENYPAIEEGDTLEVEKTFSQDDMLKILQVSNKNLMSITTDFKEISRKLAAGEGTAGKLLSDNALYDQAHDAIRSIQHVATNGQQLIQTLTLFSSKLNQEGTLANDLATDTVVFNSIRMLALHLQQIADTAFVVVEHLKTITADSTTAAGVLLHDQVEGERLKVILKNLESSSKKLDVDLEAAQSSFLLRKGMKKKAKESKGDILKNK